MSKLHKQIVAGIVAEMVAWSGEKILVQNQ